MHLARLGLRRDSRIVAPSLTVHTPFEYCISVIIFQPEFPKEFFSRRRKHVREITSLLVRARGSGADFRRHGWTYRHVHRWNNCGLVRTRYEPQPADERTDWRAG